MDHDTGEAGDVRGPVATLRRIAFLMERQREETRRIEAFRNAARTILPLAEDDVRRRAAAGTLTELPGIGPSTAAVITDACNGVVPERLVALERTAGPLARGGEERAGPAARRPALALRLVRRRLAARGDGDDGHGARATTTSCSPTTARGCGSPTGSAPSGWPASSTWSTPSTSTSTARSPCSRGSRSTSSTTARSTRPPRCSAASTCAWRPCTPSSRWTRPR